MRGAGASVVNLDLREGNEICKVSLSVRRDEVMKESAIDVLLYCIISKIRLIMHITSPFQMMSD